MDVACSIQISMLISRKAAKSPTSKCCSSILVRFAVVAREPRIRCCATTEPMQDFNAEYRARKGDSQVCNVCNHVFAVQLCVACLSVNVCRCVLHLDFAQRSEDVITHIRVEMKQEQKKWATCKRFRKATTPYLKFFKREAEDISRCVCCLRVRCVCARFLSVFAFASCACSRTVASFSQVAGEQEAAGRLAARQRDAAIDLPVVLLAD